MKHNKKLFISVEAVLAALVIILGIFMFRENNRDDFHKISVIIQNSDDNQWSAFRYGLKMAAEDQGVDLFVVSTGNVMTLEEEIEAVEGEIDHGADAVIVQPVPGADTGKMLKKMEKKVPIMLVEHDASIEKGASSFPVVKPDHYAMGKALAEELLKDYNGNIGGKKIGLAAEAEDTQGAADRRRGFLDGVKDAGVQICWTVFHSFEEDDRTLLVKQPKVDFLAALDDFSLTMAGKCSAAKDLHGALVYGIGNSTESIYYLDIGSVECVVVPDAFHTGYESLTEAAESLEHFFYKMKDRTVSFSVIRRDELFSEKNQEILFTMSQ